MPVRIFLLLGLAGFLFGCSARRDKSVAFYYWRTSFKPDSTEKQALQTTKTNTLYTRYFDIDLLPNDTMPKVIAPIRFDTTAPGFNLVPVVYIKNRVMLNLNSSGVQQLAQKILRLITAMNAEIKDTCKTIQFDCDWTVGSKQNYFLFLQEYKRIADAVVCCTIRLHQVKYRVETGVPLVDYGILMYYNMGDINAGTANSIYEKSVAEKYIYSLNTYPLPLDLALPVFAWAQQIREGRVVKLLNKMSFKHFENDSNFIGTTKNRYTVKHACFHGGYYFKENDEVKTEQVSEDDLYSIIKQVNRYSNHRICNLIFFDLDKQNLELYDKDVFEKVLDRLN